MPYFNITTKLNPVVGFVDKGLIYPEHPSILKTHVLARGAYFLLVPTVIITSAVDTIIGLGAAIVAISSLGDCRSIIEVADDHLSMKLISVPYACILKVINPYAEFSEEDLVSYDGFISDLVIKRFNKKIKECSCSKNFLERYVISRVGYALLAICSVICRIVDAVIGVPVVTLSFLTAGKFSSLNNLAYRTLQSPKVVHDLFYCVMKFISPDIRCSLNN